MIERSPPQVSPSVGRMDGDVISVERVIAAAPEAIFDLLTAPAKHALIDGSGTVVEAKSDAPSRLALGSKFGMSMKIGLPYSMVSTVVEYEENRRIAWQSRPPGRMGRITAGLRNPFCPSVPVPIAGLPSVVGVRMPPRRQHRGSQQSFGVAHAGITLHAGEQLAPPWIVDRPHPGGVVPRHTLPASPASLPMFTPPRQVRLTAASVWSRAPRSKRTQLEATPLAVMRSLNWPDFRMAGRIMLI